MNTSSNEEDSTVKVVFVCCRIANACFVLATTWIIINFIIYLTKHRHHKPQRAMQYRSSLGERHMYVVCLGAVICALPRLVMSQVLFSVAKIPNALPKCELLLDISNAFYTIAVAATYGFLWYRQRFIYKLPVIRDMTGTLARVINWIVLFIMLGSYVTLFCVYSIPPIYSWNEAGCILKTNQSRNDIKARASRYYIIISIMIAWQVTLVSLFVYPMVLIKRKQLPCSTRHKDVVKNVIRRSIICAVIAASSDLATGTVAALIPMYYPVSVATSLYDLSLQINVFCVIATFGDNPGMVTVFRSEPETQALYTSREPTAM